MKNIKNIVMLVSTLAVLAGCSSRYNDFTPVPELSIQPAVTAQNLMCYDPEKGYSIPAPGGITSCAWLLHHKK
jgi:hypothetical protein